MKFKVSEPFLRNLNRRWIPAVLLTVVFGSVLSSLAGTSANRLIVFLVMFGIAVAMWWFITRVSAEYREHDMEIRDGQMVLRYGTRIEAKKLDSISLVTMRTKNNELKSVEVKFDGAPRAMVMPYENLDALINELKKSVPEDRFLERAGFFGGKRAR